MYCNHMIYYIYKRSDRQVYQNLSAISAKKKSTIRPD